jgi:hypothetical protein
LAAKKAKVSFPIELMQHLLRSILRQYFIKSIISTFMLSFRDVLSQAVHFLVHFFITYTIAMLPWLAGSKNFASISCVYCCFTPIANFE